MNEELDKKLCKEFPDLYSMRNADMRVTCMCWGFSHSDGWFNIIYNLSRFINNAVKNFNEQLVRGYKRDKNLGYDYELTKEELDSIGYGKVKIVADQVKEKFGTLRFYWHMETSDFEFTGEAARELTRLYEQVDGAEAMACYMSSTTCEECGSPGKYRSRGWIRTLCDADALAEGRTLEEDAVEDDKEEGI